MVSSRHGRAIGNNCRCAWATQMHRGRRGGLLAFALLAAMAAFLMAAGRGSATPPGPNGLMSYREYFNADHTNGALFVINPDGSHPPTQITFPASDELDTNQNWSPAGQDCLRARHAGRPRHALDGQLERLQSAAGLPMPRQRRLPGDQQPVLVTERPVASLFDGARADRERHPERRECHQSVLVGQ
jgi:hypothetical protein